MYDKICRIISRTSKDENKIKKYSLKFWKVIALPTLLYGSESWAVKARCTLRQSTEMPYVRTDKNCTKFGYTAKDVNQEKLKILSVQNEVDARRERGETIWLEWQMNGYLHRFCSKNEKDVATEADLKRVERVCEVCTTR